MTDNSTLDAKALWQSQSVELPRMNIEFIRLRVTEVKRVARAEALSGYAAFAMLTLWVIWIFAQWPVNATLSALWMPKLIAALLYGGAIISAVRWHRFGGYLLFLGDRTNSSGLHAYRSELERSRDSRRVQLDYTPFLPGYLAWALSWWFVPTWPRHTVVFIFVALSFAATYIWSLWFRSREVERFNKEIDALQGLEK